MRDRRVIYDSEEDNEGLSPLNSPAKDGAHVLTAADDSEAERMVHQGGDSRSTDPEFFKVVYEEQQKAVSGWVSDSIRDTDARAGSSDKLKSSPSKARNNSSSITDPTLKSTKRRESEALGQIGNQNLEKLTQITTPSAPSTMQRDIYDFSLSDEEKPPVGPPYLHKASAIERTASKRKRGQSTDTAPAATTAISSRSKFLQDQGDQSPRLTRKKRKSARDQNVLQGSDDVDLLIIPTTANMNKTSDETNVEHDGLDIMDFDTHETHVANQDHPPASFFIAPPDVLTSSQKQEYLRVSGCSDLDIEVNQQQASLPVPQPAQTQGQRPQSTSASTIAYTTPSRFASSVAPLPILETLDGRSSNVASSSGRRSQLGKTFLHSSPDELNAPISPRKTRQRRAVSTVDEEEDDELPQQDSWDSNNIGHSRDTHVPRPRRLRSTADQDSVRRIQAAVDTHDLSQERHKEDERVESAHGESWDSDKIGFQGEYYAPRLSRKRSRVLMNEGEELRHPEQPMPDTCPPGDARYEKTYDTEQAAISSGQQASDQGTGGIEGIDPEFLAAMPKDIRQELINQQQVTRTSQASRPRRSGRAGEAMSGLVPHDGEAPQPKKRGRKKKENTEEMPCMFDVSPAACEEPETRPGPAPTTTAKRKRGRPRKAEAILPPPPGPQESSSAMEASELAPEATEEQSTKHITPSESPQDIVEAPKARARRGRKKKAMGASLSQSDELAETTHWEQDENGPVGNMGRLATEPLHTPVDTQAVSVENEDRQALRDISSTASNTACKSGTTPDETADKMATEEVEQQQQEVKSEPKAKEVLNSASTPGQQGKVPLRVGLSKKSRIAPLLKVIRK